MKNLVNGEDILLKSDGSSVRTYTYVADAVSAMFKILLKSNEMVYNVSDERNEVSIRQLAETISEIPPDGKLNLIFDIDDENQGYAPFKFGILSSQKIQNELGWNAKYSVKEGFERTYEFLKLVE